jgi:tetratricopeptide (TPR) repeat protein/transcriptional regulator with XRE-family HTH domain
VAFATLLWQLRTDVGLTQEELAQVAGVSTRTVSDLERGINQTARRATARRLADALRLSGEVRAEFEASALGRRPAGVSSRSDAGMETRTLPRDIATFTGREAELQALISSASSGVIGVYAVGGMAGIGKTAFAVHAAHRLAPRFPDGQIFLPLHGHTPGRAPVDPSEALASLLVIAGIPSRRIAADLEARTAQWRDRLAGRRLLLVLDDAADTGQVQPLLPSSSESLVLITSRRRLTALEEATAINLDTLSPSAAAALLVKLANRPGLAVDQAGVHEVARLSGYLPLALGMLARQLHHHPSWTPADLAADLGATQDRLDTITTENRSVAAAFNLSYGDLTVNQQQMFRWCGLHPGTDIDAYAAAALADSDLATARRQLAALYDYYLLTEPRHGRYHLHDLVREHARVLAADDPPAELAAAMDRLLDYYQRTAGTAERLIAVYNRPGPPPETGPVATQLHDTAMALAWERTERANLLACLDHVARTDQKARVVGITAALSALFQHDGPLSDAVPRHAAAARAARDIGDRLGEASALHDLGAAQCLYGEYAAATDSLEAGLHIFRDLDERLGQANALVFLGTARRFAGDQRGATQALEAGLVLARDINDQLSGAWALNNLGSMLADLGDHSAATVALKEALAIYRSLGYRLGQANALVNLAEALHEVANYPGAADALEEALAISREIGQRHIQANSLVVLGSVRCKTGDLLGAQDALQQALAISREIGHQLGEAEALNNLGPVYLVHGELRNALTCHREALGLARGIASPREEAMALVGLAHCALAAGQAAEARAELQHAHEILDRLSDSQAASVAAELTALTTESA